MNQSSNVDLSEDSLGDLTDLVEELDHRVTDLETENEQLRDKVARLQQENEALREQLEERDEDVDRLKARLRRYENPHTPPSKQRYSSSEATGDDESSARTDGGTIGRNPGHEAAWRPLPDPDEVIEVTEECCPDCGDQLGDATTVIPRFIEEIPDPDPIETTRFDVHQYDCERCAETVEASHPNCPAEGNFGPTVQAQAALARYAYRLPYRKIADRFEHLFDLDLSPASAWFATNRLAEAGRDEYEEIRDRLRDADVVHVDETGHKVDGQQWWLWTFRSGEDILYVLRNSRGSSVPAEILGAEFDGTIVCDGWSAYPAFHEDLQRCWAHLLREADDLADDHPEADVIARRLHGLFAGVQSFLDTEPTPAQRARMRKRARASLEAIVEMDVETEEVQQLLGKIEGGLDHWLRFVTDPAVPPTNNAAENALREPVVLRKIIGTLRTDIGRFTHETLFTLLATWEQQGLNPYEELQRIARA